MTHDRNAGVGKFVAAGLEDGITDPRRKLTRNQVKFFKMLVKVLMWILIALLFLAAAFDTAFAVVLCCLGVVVCSSVAAVLVDRHVRR